jgi:Carboxypeptidase regulatory-like domain/TonB-dependent Receptor Plug Domain
MTTIKRSSSVLVLLAIVGTTRAAFAVGEQTGRVRGVVRDNATHQPLIAVTVSARGPALIGGPAAAMTDDDGRYELLGLPQGDYTIEFSYPDMMPTVRRATVRSGEAITVNVDWSLQQTGVDTVSVNVERQRTKPDSTQSGTVVNMDTLSRIPTGRSYQTASLLVAGTSGGGNPNVKGAAAGNNRYLIDGLDATDPASNTFSLNLTFDSLESVEVITGGMEAQYNAIGGVINVITRGGGDNFHTVDSVVANRHELSATGNYGSNIYEGLQDWNDNPSGPNEAYRLAFTVGGPIVRRKLWYSATYEFVLNRSTVIPSQPLGVPPYNVQHPTRQFLGHDMRLKLAYAPSPEHRVSLTANADPAFIDNTGQSNTYLGVAETRQNQGGLLTVLSWDWLRWQHVLPSLQVGILYNIIENGPQGRLGTVDFTGCDKFNKDLNCTYDRDRARHINVTDNTTWYQGPNSVFDHRIRLEADPTVVVRSTTAGLHTIKAGIQGQYQRHSLDVETPGGSVFRDRAGTGDVLESGLCNLTTGFGCFRRTDNDPYSYANYGFSLGFFAQDNWWTPLQWLTVVPGIRFDHGRTFDRNGTQRTSLFGIGPRLGLVADITKDGRNVLYTYYGRKTEPLNLAQVGQIDANELGRTVTNEWDPVTMGFNQFVTQTGGVGTISVAPGTTMPHADELSVGFRRELVPSTVGSVEYTYKRQANPWTLIEVNRIWDPTGSRVVDYVDRSRAGQQLFEYRTPDDPRIYHGFIFSSEGRPNPRWDYGASYTLSWSYALFTPSQANNVSNVRQARFLDGYLGQDQRHFVRLYGSYSGIHNLVVGGNFTYQSGVALTKTYYNAQTGAYDNQRSPNGTLPGSTNDPIGISEFRTPDLLNLDLKIAYNLLPSGLQHRLSVIADVFNAFSLRTPNALTTNDIARFGQVAGRQAPLRVQVAVEYRY